MTGEAIEVTYRVDPALYRQAMAAWAKEPGAEGGFRRYFAMPLAGALVGGALMLFVLLGLKFEPDDSHFIAALVGAALVFALWALTYRRQIAQLGTYLDEADEKAGPTTAVFDADGIRFSTRLGESLVRWPAIGGVIPLKGGTALRAGAIAYPIPDAALPEGVTPEMFRTRLDAWREV